jgi:hypothetical protein
VDPRGFSPAWLVAAALGVALAALVAALGIKSRLRRRRVAIRAKRAVEGEAHAAEWLSADGYAILGAQVATEYSVDVDGDLVQVHVRADYLVERGGRRYVAEVKTGSQAPKLGTPATRRQLLEYRVAFDVDGVLLVDAEAGRVHAVTFPGLEEGTRPRPLAWGVAVLAIAAVVVIAWIGARP